MVRTKVCLSLVCGLLAGSLGGCRDERPVPAAAPSSSAAPEPPAPVVSCGASQDTVFYVAPEREATTGGEPGVVLPFAVELGGATTYNGGFAVGALREGEEGTHAVLAALPTKGPAGRVVDLMRVHGMVVPPQVTALGSEVIVAIADSDANGVLARLARVDLAVPTADVSFGAMVPQGNDESAVFGIRVHLASGILFWDEWDAASNHGVVKLVRFAPDDLSKVSGPITLSPEGQDAEAPRILPNPGGYWAAWMTHAPRQPPADGKARAAAQTDHGADDSGPQWVSVRPLGPDATPLGAAIDVTPKTQHALSYDTAVASDGGLLVVWREDKTSVATAGGQLHLAKVAISGSVERRPIQSERIGAGVPTLLAEPGATPSTWLAIGTPADDTMLGAIDASGQLINAVDSVEALKNSVALARRGDSLLVVRPRGRRAELGIVTCQLSAQRRGGSD